MELFSQTKTIAMPVYKLSKNVVLESFEDGGLVLILPQRSLIELNPTAVEIVKLLDGKRTLEQVAKKTIKAHAIDHDISETQINHDLSELIIELNQAGVLELQSSLEESVN